MSTSTNSVYHTSTNSVCHEEAHKVFMQRCLQLAKSGAGAVAPNPLVGAVLVHEGSIIGEGFHQKFGEAHAEVNCIRDALKKAPGQINKATLYVNLEPCAHYGKTPPCADLIISHKIPKVVIGCRDSFKEVNGRGIEKLKQAGIEVVEGVLKEKAIAVNKRFFTFHEHKRPYIILKWAQTADSFIAPPLPRRGGRGERLLISNEYTNRLVHQWRSEEAGILVGANTVIKDDPLLDNRHWYGDPPVKIIADPALKAPYDLKLFEGNTPVIILNDSKEGKQANTRFVKIPREKRVQAMLAALYELDIQSILVEGGQKILQSFIDANLWDEARVITNTSLHVGKGLAAPELQYAIKTNEEIIFSDRIDYFKHRDNRYL